MQRLSGFKMLSGKRATFKELFVFTKSSEIYPILDNVFYLKTLLSDLEFGLNRKIINSIIIPVQ